MWPLPLLLEDKCLSGVRPLTECRAYPWLGCCWSAQTADEALEAECEGHVLNGLVSLLIVCRPGRWSGLESWFTRILLVSAPTSRHRSPNKVLWVKQVCLLCLFLEGSYLLATLRLISQSSRQTLYSCQKTRRSHVSRSQGWIPWTGWRQTSTLGPKDQRAKGMDRRSLELKRRLPGEQRMRRFGGSFPSDTGHPSSATTISLWPKGKWAGIECRRHFGGLTSAFFFLLFFVFLS